MRPTRANGGLRKSVLDFFRRGESGTSPRADQRVASSTAGTSEPVPRFPKVYLVGAGPGDPELLTLKAVRALAAADVILVDDLVNPAVLAHARPDARVVHVGKRGPAAVGAFAGRARPRRASTDQAFIEQSMVAEALRGRVVVRLKGGDPFVFGRGGEELAALRRRGIAVDVVHGVTAGIAAPGALGIAVTHRLHTHGVALVTAATRAGDRPDWAALARSGLTLVIYMGLARVEALQRELVAAGFAAGVPCAIVEHATLPTQRGVVTTLAALAAAARRHGLGGPAIIVVGAVVRDACAGTLDQLVRDAMAR
jgi:uroporphyrin-III C-methyltransferase